MDRFLSRWFGVMRLLELRRESTSGSLPKLLREQPTKDEETACPEDTPSDSTRDRELRRFTESELDGPVDRACNESQ